MSIKSIIKSGYLPILIVVILLNCPSFIYDNLIIYRTFTDFKGGDYANLVFNYSAINLILLLWGAGVYNRKSFVPNFYLLLFFVLLKDLFLLISGNSYALQSWEMYLSLATGMSCCAIVGNVSRSRLCFEKFIDWLVLANFIWQVLFWVTGRVGDSGRVSVMGQGPGGVGFMYALEIVYIFAFRLRDKRAILILLVSLLGIILSGSRFSLVVVFFSIFFFYNQLFKGFSLKIRLLIIVLILLVGGALTYILLNAELQNQYAIIERMGGMYSFDDMSEDQSLLERIESFIVGFEILDTNRFGVSFSYGDLQYNMINRGFFAFPHSTLLCYYLFWGPIMIYCVYWMFKYIYISNKQKLIRERNMLYYLLLIFIIYGGVCISTKDIVFHIAFISLLIRRIKEAKFESISSCSYKI